MNFRITRIGVNAPILLAASADAAESLSVSGIYPHLTVFNSDPKR